VKAIGAMRGRRQGGHGVRESNGDGSQEVWDACIGGGTHVKAFGQDVRENNVGCMHEACGCNGLQLHTCNKTMWAVYIHAYSCIQWGEGCLQVKAMDYSCIVFDTAPTGHTLRLLQFPTVLQKGLNKLMDMKNMFGGALDAMAAMMGPQGFEGAQNQAMEKLEAMKV
jgi:Anion-transporting ATPase